MFNQVTPVQVLLLCWLFVFGPIFGFWAAFRALDSKFGPIPSFLFASFCSYMGWFLPILIAILCDLHFTWSVETAAAVYSIPGFITGYLGIKFLDSFHRKHKLPPASGPTA